MTEGDIRVGADERTEVDSVAGSYYQVGSLVWEIGMLCLYTVRLGYVGTNWLETPVEGSTLDVCKIQTDGAL